MTHTSHLEIPQGILYNSENTLRHMLERGLKAPGKITSTCHAIAEVTCHKMDVMDRRMIRALTNRLVSLAHNDVGL